MSYVTRSGRRTKKVNYSDTQRSTSTRSVTPQQTPTPKQSDKENDSEIEIMDNIPEPPQKKQKISNDTSASTSNKSSPQKRRRRRPIRRKKKLTQTDNDNDNDNELDLTSFDNTNKNTKNTKNTNKNNTNNKNTSTSTSTSTSSNIPPPLQPLQPLILPPLPLFVIPPLPSCPSTNHNKTATKKRRVRKRKKTSKQELSDSDSSSSDSSSDELEILPELPRKKRKLPTLKAKKKAAKKSPKKKKAKKKVIEKRRARKRKCTQKVRDRISRARHQRLFMVNAKEIGEFEREYAVLGSTGNVYTINIGTLNTCTCPDYCKGNLCKHIMFILLKVLRVPSHSEYVYQKALLTSELSEIFAAAPQTLFGSVLANADVRNKYKQSIGDDGSEDIVVEGKVNRKELVGECPVCMEDIDEKEATTYCRAQCGNNVHVQCFNQWRKNAERSGEAVSCMFCRAEWIYGAEDGNGKGKGKKKRKKTSGGGGVNEGYLNLADEQGMSTVRDTSTYYRNGWNGYGSRRYGYGWGRRW